MRHNPYATFFEQKVQETKLAFCEACQVGPKYNPRAGYNGLPTREARAPVGNTLRNPYVLPAAVTGFCLGGTLTYGAATNLPGFSVAVGYYGGQIVRMADRLGPHPALHRQPHVR
jgi:hypothetical protein